ncbi:DUF2061 domain-containing protein [Gammaproteobacteria bacterium]|jgi:uncharacterized membrane protein|nr:DUF2061 domain-containing protein [Gammaproteobacteria bacterium]|tara:strand:- start:184 stop:450 length:267 start_codon:yes stop_codon:yes gene_type:complete
MIQKIKRSVSVFNAPIKRVLENNQGTILRTVIYTLGHFIIAASCVVYFTGANFQDAITDAIVEPLINGVWYFVLDKYWASRFPRAAKS